MALQKTITTQYDVEGSYIKISEIYIDRLAGRAAVKHPLWKDQQASNEGKQPMQLLHSSVDISALSPADSATIDAFVELMYNLVKVANPELSGALDV